MTYEEAMRLAPVEANGCADIAHECDSRELSYMDEPVITMIHATDFGLLAEIIRALVAGPNAE